MSCSCRPSSGEGIAAAAADRLFRGADVNRPSDESEERIVGVDQAGSGSEEENPLRRSG
jgi:hypothetical protein